MLMCKKWLLVFSLITVLYRSPYIHATSVLLLDTEEHSPYLSSKEHKAQVLLQAAGFIPDYYSLYSCQNIDYSKYQAVFIILDTQFIQNIEHPLVQSTLARVVAFAQQENKLIGIFTPAGTTSARAYNNLNNFLPSLFPTWYTNHRALVESFLKVSLAPDNYKSWFYDTNLLEAREAKPQFLQALEQIRQELQPASILDQCIALPQLAASCFAQQLAPLGIMGYDSITKNYLFITSASFLTCTQAQENLLITPLDQELRKDLYTTMMHLLAEVQTKYTQKNLRAQYTTLPIVSDNQLILPKKLPYSWAPNGIYCGWLELQALVKTEETVKTAIQAIYTAKLNMLWLQIRPELYISRRALWAFKKEELFAHIAQFTQALQEFKPANQAIPKIFIGLELTGNYMQQIPMHSVIDIYGVNYPNIPCPLDYEHFWKSEVIDVLEQFIDQWPTISNNLPIGGFMFDLQMYHAQDQACLYNSFMDFSDHSWQLFTNAIQREDLTALTLQERIPYLYDHALFDTYFSVLKDQAYALGQILKNAIKTKLPESILAVYTPTLLDSWFYRGLLSGLSSPQEPIILATFNTDYYSHLSQLQAQNIYAYHLSVLLLSKLRSQESFALIPQLQQAHDGIWYNRFSRLVQSRDPKDRTWDYGLEVTPLDTQTVTTALADHHT